MYKQTTKPVQKISMLFYYNSISVEENDSVYLEKSKHLIVVSQGDSLSKRRQINVESAHISSPPVLVLRPVWSSPLHWRSLSG